MGKEVFFVTRRFCLGLLAAFAARPAAAQHGYPNHLVKLIVPFPPGGGNDVLARILSQQLSTLWDRTVIVENRPGGNTVIGAQILASATPDGYTLMLTSSAQVIIPNLMKVPFDPVRDFAPVTTVSSSELILAVNPGVAANTLEQFIALAKSEPGKLNYASGGYGDPNRLAGVLFDSMTGAKMVHIPYNGGGPALTALIGGQVQAFFVAPAAVLPNIKSGNVRAIAISGTHRLATLPDVPTFTEAGLPGFNVRQWYGVLAPAATPKPVLDKIAADIASIVATPAMKKALAQQGMDPFVSTPEAFGTLMRADLARYAAIIKAAGINPQ